MRPWGQRDQEAVRPDTDGPDSVHPAKGFVSESSFLICEMGTKGTFPSIMGQEKEVKIVM